MRFQRQRRIPPGGGFAGAATGYPGRPAVAARLGSRQPRGRARPGRGGGATAARRRSQTGPIRGRRARLGRRGRCGTAWSAWSRPRRFNGTRSARILPPARRPPRLLDAHRQPLDVTLRLLEELRRPTWSRARTPVAPASCSQRHGISVPLLAVHEHNEAVRARRAGGAHPRRRAGGAGHRCRHARRCPIPAHWLVAAVAAAGLAVTCCPARRR